VKWYRKAAEQGDVQAQYDLGKRYHEGLGVAKDDNEAIKWLRKAGEGENGKGQDLLNTIEANVEDVWVRSAAEQGDAKAQFKLGQRYHHGWGVARSEAEAEKWFRKAAEQGDVEALWFLGWKYEHGRGVARNRAEAVKWYRKAAEQGDAKAQCRLGEKYHKGRDVAQDDGEAVKWYRKAAEQGDEKGQYRFGLMVLEGRGVPQSYDEAERWLRKSAIQGNSMAQSMLNSRIAFFDVERLRKSAEQGDAIDQWFLGQKYESGWGVTENHDEAVKRYRKAAKLGFAGGRISLEVIYRNSFSALQDVEDIKKRAELVEWIRKGAEQGDASAQHYYGLICMFGNFEGKFNYEEAIKWFRKASEQGNKDASLQLRDMYLSGQGVARSEGEAEKWERKAVEQGYNPRARY
jgi:TPR repeat protein